MSTSFGRVTHVFARVQTYAECRKRHLTPDMRRAVPTVN